MSAYLMVEGYFGQSEFDRVIRYMDNSTEANIGLKAFLDSLLIKSSVPK